MLRSIPGLHSLDSSNLPQSSCEYQKCLQTLSHIPKRTTLPQLRTTILGGKHTCQPFLLMKKLKMKRIKYLSKFKQLSTTWDLNLVWTLNHHSICHWVIISFNICSPTNSLKIHPAASESPDAHGQIGDFAFSGPRSLEDQSHMSIPPLERLATVKISLMLFLPRIGGKPNFVTTREHF